MAGLCTLPGNQKGREHSLQWWVANVIIGLREGG